MERTEEQIKKEFDENWEKIKRTTIQISRIPEQYKTRFMEIAEKEFSKDYGMCLRELIRTYDGIYVNPNEEILAKIEILASEISSLKEQFAKHTQEPKKENTKTMADGSIKRIG